MKNGQRWVTSHTWESVLMILTAAAGCEYAHVRWTIQTKKKNDYDLLFLVSSLVLLHRMEWRLDRFGYSTFKFLYRQMRSLDLLAVCCIFYVPVCVVFQICYCFSILISSPRPRIHPFGNWKLFVACGRHIVGIQNLFIYYQIDYTRSIAGIIIVDVWKCNGIRVIYGFPSNGGIFMAHIFEFTPLLSTIEFKNK